MALTESCHAHSYSELHNNNLDSLVCRLSGCRNVIIIIIIVRKLNEVTIGGDLGQVDCNSGAHCDTLRLVINRRRVAPPRPGGKYGHQMAYAMNNNNNNNNCCCC